MHNKYLLHAMGVNPRLRHMKKHLHHLFSHSHVHSHTHGHGLTHHFKHLQIGCGAGTHKKLTESERQEIHGEGVKHHKKLKPISFKF